jgi:chromosome segregation ATPase
VSYVFQNIFLCLLAATALGIAMGWLMRGFGFAAKVEALENEWLDKNRLLESDNAKLAGQWKEAGAAADAAKQKLASLEADHSRLQADFSGISGRLPVLENAITGWTAKAATWDSDRQKLHADLRACADARSALEVQLAEYTTRARAWDAERATLRANLSRVANDDAIDDAAYEKTIASLRASLDAAQLKVKHAEIAANEWQTKHAALETQLKAALAESDRASAVDIAAYEKTIATLRAELDGAQARLFEAEIAARESQAALQATVASLRAELSAALAAPTTETLRAELDAAQAKLHQAEAQARQSQAQQTALNATIASLRAELASAQTMPRAMAAAVGGASTESLQSRFQSIVMRTQREGWGDIERIQGIGPAYGQKLRAVGIAWVKDLLEEAGDPDGRARLAADTGIERNLILQWVSAADLLRVPGITPEWAELLEAAGVDHVGALHTRTAPDLHKKLTDTNASGHYARSTPDAASVAAWLEAARRMEPRVTR